MEHLDEVCATVAYARKFNNECVDALSLGCSSKRSFLNTGGGGLFRAFAMKLKNLDKLDVHGRLQFHSPIMDCIIKYHSSKTYILLQFSEGLSSPRKHHCDEMIWVNIAFWCRDLPSAIIANAKMNYQCHTIHAKHAFFEYDEYKKTGKE